MGRAGRSSGGRSSGSRGGRSFGSRSSAGRSVGSGRSSRSSSASRSSSGPGHGRNFTFIPIRSYSSGYSGSSSGGWHLNWVAIAIIVVMIAAVAFKIFPGLGGSDVTASTINREPLPKGHVTETEYYTDELGWIESVTVLEKGMKEFYSKTGVQPYVYIMDTVPPDMTMEDYADKLYSELFEDEAHFLLLFCEADGQYTMQWVCGKEARTVVDQEAADIILDCVEKYYYHSELSESEMFSKAFADAAKRMMSKTVPSYLYVVGTLGAAVVVVIAFIWWKAAKMHKKEEAERDERILSTPLESFGDKDLEDLEKKYTKN